MQTSSDTENKGTNMTRTLIIDGEPVEVPYVPPAQCQADYERSREKGCSNPLRKEKKA
jgi:hypothetical protein